MEPEVLDWRLRDNRGDRYLRGKHGGGLRSLQMMIMAIDSAAAINMGASWQQVLKGDAIGLAAATIGGYIGGALAGEGPPLAQVIGGAVGGAVAGSISTLLGGSLGQSILVGAIFGAATAAETVAIQGENPLSVASAARRGPGGRW